MIYILELIDETTEKDRFEYPSNHEILSTQHT